MKQHLILSPHYKNKKKGGTRMYDEITKRNKINKTRTAKIN